MTKFVTRGVLLVALFGGAVLLTTGCGKTDPTPAKDEKVSKDKDKDKEKVKPKDGEDDHSGWWCKPHGIPEEECSMCSDEYAAKCKAKTPPDWCEKHDRADSQCFICHPEHQEKFAAKYRAKYGTEPPPIKLPKK